jgi:hypothetical protein
MAAGHNSKLLYKRTLDCITNPSRTSREQPIRGALARCASTHRSAQPTSPFDADQMGIGSAPDSAKG